MFHKRVPTWVKDFPITADKAALTQLATASKGSFEHPREMNFSLYDFSPGPGLEEVEAKLKEQGWRLDTMEQSDAPSKYVITATKDNYVMA